jgi:hypothetical protein
MPILAVAILLLLEDGTLVVAASAAVEGKRHQTTTNHQSENDADTQERVAPTGQFNVARSLYQMLFEELEQRGLKGTPEYPKRHVQRRSAR